MPLVIPLHAKVTFNAQRVEDEPVILLDVADTSLGTSTLRYCSLPVVRLSSEPLQYGVVSGGFNYIYALTGHLPSDEEGATLRAQLVLDNADQEMTDLFIGLTADNAVVVTLVLASVPDEVIRRFENLHITEVSNTDEGALTLTIDRDFKAFGGSAVEPWPSGRQTINQAPGLHRQ
jgi:hypothetical protein